MKRYILLGTILALFAMIIPSMPIFADHSTSTDRMQRKECQVAAKNKHIEARLRARQEFLPFSKYTDDASRRVARENYKHTLRVARETWRAEKRACKGIDNPNPTNTVSPTPFPSGTPWPTGTFHPTPTPTHTPLYTPTPTPFHTPTPTANPTPIQVSCSSAGPDNITITGDGIHDVYAYGVRNAINVYFAVWANANGQNDLVWYKATNLGGGTWRATVNFNKHAPGHPEYGTYTAYAYMNGNEVFCDSASFTRSPNHPTPTPHH